MKVKKQCIKFFLFVLYIELILHLPSLPVNQFNFLNHENLEKGFYFLKFVIINLSMTSSSVYTIS